MRILMTGGTGDVGRAAVQYLAQLGHFIKVIGRSKGVSIPSAEYALCDIGDYPLLREMVRGFDAVVHLAAVRNPFDAPSHQVFMANVQGTFNVYKACEEEGIQRVVQASSINALGTYYGKRPAAIRYLPVDEDHPCESSDVYSFSKHVIEDIGEYYWRRSGISGAALRLPWVAPASYHSKIGERREGVQRLVDKLLALPAAKRRAWFEAAWQQYNNMRAMGAQEDPTVSQRMRQEHPEWFGEEWQAMVSRVNFFTMLDERDSAAAIEKALTSRYGGSHPLHINDSQNWTGIPSQTLADLFYPDVTSFKKPLQGFDTLVSIERARELLGFEVHYSFGA